MKWFIACLAALFSFTVALALAGEGPYVAIVGNDLSADGFYLSPKYVQFLLNQLGAGVPTTGEQFQAQMPVTQPEICDTQGIVFTGGSFPIFGFSGRPNSRVTAGNAGWYEWSIRLPTKPVGEINLVFQCGIIKPNTFAHLKFAAVQYCAAETGERIGEGFCSHLFVDPGIDPLVAGALPRITATASAGPYNSFTPFSLTAYKNPGTYALSFTPETLAIANDAASQVLDGSTATRILLKSCMDKAIPVKLPVAGQVNVRGQAEADLLEGDLISVRLYIPRSNTVDVYCHDQSLRLMGIGEATFGVAEPQFEPK